MLLLLAELTTVFFLRFFLEDKLSCPESDSDPSEAPEDEEEEELLELEESELESEAWPDDFFRSI